MHTRKNHRNKDLNYQVFRRWSRKSYAIFASMHKEIKISFINAGYSILESTEKLESLFLFIEDRFCFEQDELDDELSLCEGEILNIRNEKTEELYIQKILQLLLLFPIPSSFASLSRLSKLHISILRTKTIASEFNLS